MELQKTIKNKKLAKTLLLTAMATTLLFWGISQSFDVYTYIITGAIFEMLSIPMLLITFAVPVTATVFFFKDGVKVRSPFLYIAMLSLALPFYLFLSE